MYDAFWDSVALVLLKNDPLTSLDVKVELAVNDEEELVLVVMFVPMIFATENAQPHESVIYCGQRLIKPRHGHRIRLRTNVDERERSKLVIHVHDVPIGVIFA